MTDSSNHNGRLDPLQLLTLAEVAEITQRSQRSLRRDIAAGRMHAVHLGRSVRVPRLELERIVTEAKQGA